MTNRFEGRVVLVTGASSGIGRMTAVAFGREGAKVVVSGRRREQLDQTLALVREMGGDGLAVTGDCSKAADVRRMVDAAVTTYGRLDCAFNNAGIEGGKPFVPTADYSEEIWDEVIAVNLTGVFLCVQGAFRMSGEGKAEVAGRNLVLVDDVLTSGATVDACARALLRAKADTVDVLVFARVVDSFKAPI